MKEKNLKNLISPPPPKKNSSSDWKKVSFTHNGMKGKTKQNKTNAQKQKQNTPKYLKFYTFADCQRVEQYGKIPSEREEEEKERKKHTKNSRIQIPWQMVYTLNCWVIWKCRCHRQPKKRTHKTENGNARWVSACQQPRVRSWIISRERSADRQTPKSFLFQRYFNYKTETASNAAVLQTIFCVQHSKGTLNIECNWCRNRSK